MKNELEKLKEKKEILTKKEIRVGAIFCFMGIVSISCIIYVINLGNALSAIIICPILLISPLILLTKLREIQECKRIIEWIFRNMKITY
ncbi:hypothetical protein KRE40_18470 [Elizabethkingia meningoseptica]|uniref:hypothetical protein n=1 Tax=Elizabethkingia meningoseptica TaxID=238 RepID=UPI0023AF106A|nr:hypothetical protein [Elizabethkingia meningoseptica]MDE5510626.1 hypothetical protein [Elizabethkingia meningoseptica]